MQGSKKKAFLTLELIIVIVVITTILAFAVPKIFQIVGKSYELALKADVTLIKNGILEEKNRLIQTQQLSKQVLLDNASIDKEGEELFKNILRVPIISTSSSEKRTGKWAKVSNDSYMFFLQKDFVKFSLKDNSFICFDSLLCKDLN